MILTYPATLAMTSSSWNGRKSAVRMRSRARSWRAALATATVTGAAGVSAALVSTLAHEPKATHKMIVPAISAPLRLCVKSGNTNTDHKEDPPPSEYPPQGISREDVPYLFLGFHRLLVFRLLPLALWHDRPARLDRPHAFPGDRPHFLLLIESWLPPFHSPPYATLPDKEALCALAVWACLNSLSSWWSQCFSSEARRSPR